MNGRSLQLHLWWTALLVLTALGGAGLAVAADRPGNPVQRPELTWAADNKARPWITALAEALSQVHDQATAMSSAGRDVLERLQTLDTAGATEALAAGDQASSEIDAFLVDLRDLQAHATAQVERWRLGPQMSGLFDDLDAAITAAPDLAVDWAGVADIGRAVSGLVEALGEHDALVFQATSAGRAARWADALELLGHATTDSLATAGLLRDHLVTSTTVETLDQLLERDRAYDDALVALYTYLRDGGQSSGNAFKALQDAVDRAQAALPDDNGALAVIVGEATGAPIADALVAMDEVHGTINDALDNVAEVLGQAAP